MPTYGKKDFKESNVNYLNKDFNALKQSLVNYAQAYFPNTYKDFNETSPGMMLIEMSAYVGDVLSFYIDQQYKELLLPLAEERRNIINMAKMLGYKVKPIVPSFVELSFTSEVNALSTNRAQVDYSNASVFQEGIKVQSSANSNLYFETLDVVDFRVTSSLNNGEASDTSSPIIDTATDGLITDYTLTRKVRAVSGETKTKTFTITSPQKFRRITLPETNVIDIISCKDSNNNEWYEVDFLAQDQVPVKKHYAQDELRDNAYTNIDGTDYVADVPVPYSLQYIKTTKRFTRETNTDNSTSLVFGNGILKNGEVIDEGFIDLEQVGIIIPGQQGELNDSIDPLLGDEYSTLGETPTQTTLTITYRIGGGIEANASVGDLTSIIGTPTKLVDGGASIAGVTNETAARGGADEEDTDEIREKARAFFTTQNRCVTKEDYEARTMNMSSRFGNIAKVIVSRTELPSAADIQSEYQGIIDNSLGEISTTHQSLQTNVGNFGTDMSNAITDAQSDIQNLTNQFTSNQISALQLVQQANLLFLGVQDTYNNYFQSPNLIPGDVTTLGEQISQVDVEVPLLQELDAGVGTIAVNILAYDKNKNLVGNAQAGGTLLPDATDGTPIILNTNLSNYLNNFKLLTDDVAIQDGYIINFGVVFDVVAHRYANKAEVKLRCIQKIIDYFKIEKMQFNQPIIISQLEYELMDIDGVRSVNYVCVTQTEDYVGGGEGFDNDGERLFTYSYADNAITTDGGTAGYGYAYDFPSALTNGIILPASPQTPAVFELKNPRQNVKGVVR
jgi:hypothetical protein